MPPCGSCLSSLADEQGEVFKKTREQIVLHPKLTGVIDQRQVLEIPATVSEVNYKTGSSDVYNLSRALKDQYGQSPTAFASQNNGN